jgi:hypothetical protein
LFIFSQCINCIIYLLCFRFTNGRTLILASPPGSQPCRYSIIMLKRKNEPLSVIAYTRRKTRLLESNAKCRHLKYLTCKGTLGQMFYLSDAPSPLLT